jgi:hypothetical protein
MKRAFPALVLLTVLLLATGCAQTGLTKAELRSDGAPGTKIILSATISVALCSSPLCTDTHEDALMLLSHEGHGRIDASNIRVFRKLWPDQWIEERGLVGHIELHSDSIDLRLLSCRVESGRNVCMPYPFNGRTGLRRTTSL